MRTIHILTFALCASAGAAVFAQDAFPSRPVRIVIPFVAGTGSDGVARAMTDSMSKSLGVPVTVDNREGASGMIGTQYVAKQPPDGYTILLAATNMVLTSFVTNPAPYHPVKDFDNLGRIATVPMVMLTATKGPFKTFQDVVNAAKSAPGKLNYGTSGKMGTSHVFTEQILKQFDFNAKDVHYKNPAQAIIDTASGQPELLLSNIPLAAGMIQKGDVRVVATGSAKRLASMPNVPTFAELANRPDFTTVLWYGFFSPVGVPQPVKAKLMAAIATAMQEPEVRKKIELTGGQVELEAPEAFARQVVGDTETFGRIIKDLGLDKP